MAEATRPKVTLYGTIKMKINLIEAQARYILVFCLSFYHYSNFELVIDKKLKLNTSNLGKDQKAQAQLIVKCRLVKNFLLITR